MIPEVLLALAVAYAVSMIVFSIAVSKARYSVDRKYRPTVSIIIAARNEEQNIRRCLESMVHLTYPSHLLEVVVVDDRSTDGTQAVVREFSARYPCMKSLIAEAEAGGLRGKTNAITQGIEVSSGEILLFTDADCTVQSHWVEETVKYYTNKDIGIVAGFTSLQAGRWFESIQALDWFVLFSVAAAGLRLGFPITAIGNNLSVRRKVYDLVGGYRMLPFSVTEDYALFDAITKTRKYAARFPLDRSTLVESKACGNLRELYKQKKRWFTGGANIDARRMIPFCAVYALNVLLPASLLTSGLSGLLVPITLKTLADLILAIPTLTTFRRWNLLLYFPLFEVYYIVYLVVMPVVALFGKKVVWKERTFNHRESP